MFEKYKEYLSYDFSEDYWSDEGITIAGEMLAKFSDLDWNKLKNYWNLESKIWKIRCAETLDIGLKSEGANILLSMLNDNESELVVMATDSLRSWPEGSFKLEMAEISNLKKIRDVSGNIDKLVLTAFINSQKN